MSAAHTGDRGRGARGSDALAVVLADRISVAEVDERRVAAYGQG